MQIAVMKGFPSAKVKPEPASQVKSARSSVTTMFSVGKFSPSMSGHTGPIYERRQERNNNNECCQCSLPVNKINIESHQLLYLSELDYKYSRSTCLVPPGHLQQNSNSTSKLLISSKYVSYTYIYIYMMNSQCML